MDSECEDYLWRAILGQLTPEEKADRERMERTLKELFDEPTTDRPDPDVPGTGRGNRA